MFASQDEQSTQDGPAQATLDPEPEKADDEGPRFADWRGDGRVTAKQLKKMMQTLGNAITDEEVADIMKEARVDRGGSISFAEFSRLMGVGIKHTVEADPEEDMRHAFRLFDQDKDGFISPKEMISALSKFGITINDKEVKQLIGEATLGGEKRVNFETFKKVITQAVH